MCQALFSWLRLETKFSRELWKFEMCYKVALSYFATAVMSLLIVRLQCNWMINLLKGLKCWIFKSLVKSTLQFRCHKLRLRYFLPACSMRWDANPRLRNCSQFLHPMSHVPCTPSAAVHVKPAVSSQLFQTSYFEPSTSTSCIDSPQVTAIHQGLLS